MKRKQNDAIVDFSIVFSIPRFLVTKFVVFACMALATILFRQKTIGRHNLSKFKDTGCLIASNHSLYLDPMIITRATSTRRIFYSAMRNTFDVPFLGIFIRLLGAFPISGRIGLNQIITPVKKLLNQGRFVLFFPEGFLEHPGWELQEFKSGVFFLACQLNVPVVPLVIISKPRRKAGFWESQFVSRVKVVIGKPLYPDMGNTAGASGQPDRDAIKELSDRTWKAMNEILKKEYGG